MQSTPNPNFDDAFDEIFADEAWKNMNAMLDREMPVEKKRNRGLLIWWTNGYAKCIAAGFALLLGIGIWRTFMNITPIYEVTNMPQDANNQSVATTKSHESAQFSIIESQKSINITTNQYNQEAAKPHANKRLDSTITIYKHQQHDHENILLTQKTHFNNSTSPVLPITDDPILPTIVHEKIDTSVALANSERKNDAEKAISTNILEAVDTHTLPALPLALLENMPAKDYMYEDATATMPQNTRWWKQDIKASIHSIFNSRKTLVGGEIGIATSFRLNDKIAISVGLSGRRRSYSVVLPDSATAAVPGVKTNPVILTPVINTMNPDSNKTYFLANIAINSLQMPIIFSRSVSKHWSLGAGITPTLNLTRRNSLIADIQTQNTPFTKSPSTNTPMSDAAIQADWSIKDIPAIPANQNSSEVQYFYTNQIQQNLRRLNILSGLYAMYAVEKINFVASVEYNLLGYNTYNNTGHSIVVKVGVEKNF